MNQSEKAAIRSVVDAWKRAAPVLEAVRKEEIRNADTSDSIAAFRGLVLEKIKSHPPSLTSGLVEQQRLFRLLASRP